MSQSASQLSKSEVLIKEVKCLLLRYGCDSTSTQHSSVLAEVKILLLRSLNAVLDVSDYLQM